MKSGQTIFTSGFLDKLIDDLIGSETMADDKKARECPLVQLRCTECEFPVAVDGSCFQCKYIAAHALIEEMAEALEKCQFAFMAAKITFVVPDNAMTEYRKWKEGMK